MVIAPNGVVVSSTSPSAEVRRTERPYDDGVAVASAGSRQSMVAPSTRRERSVEVRTPVPRGSTSPGPVSASTSTRSPAVMARPAYATDSSLPVISGPPRSLPSRIAFSSSSGTTGGDVRRTRLPDHGAGDEHGRDGADGDERAAVGPRPGGDVLVEPRAHAGGRELLDRVGVLEVDEVDDRRAVAVEEAAVLVELEAAVVASRHHAPTLTPTGGSRPSKRAMPARRQATTAATSSPHRRASTSRRSSPRRGSR